MKMVEVKFSAVPVGGFYFVDGLGWLFRASRRIAYRGAPTYQNRYYVPAAGALVKVIA